MACWRSNPSCEFRCRVLVSGLWFPSPPSYFFLFQGLPGPSGEKGKVGDVGSMVQTRGQESGTYGGDWFLGTPQDSLSILSGSYAWRYWGGCSAGGGYPQCSCSNGPRPSHSCSLLPPHCCPRTVTPAPAVFGQRLHPCPVFPAPLCSSHCPSIQFGVWGSLEPLGLSPWPLDALVTPHRDPMGLQDLRVPMVPAV